MSDQPITSALLPPNQTMLETALANASAMPHTPEVLRLLWDAQRCPLPQLPWLAWALSVDEWDDSWSEAQKRAQVLGSIALHRKKGTPWAVKEALRRAGLERVQLTEKPENAHWAEFDVEIDVVDRPVSQATLTKAIALIDAYKAARSHLRRLVVSLSTKNQAHVAAVTLGGDITTVLPLQLTHLYAQPLVPCFAAGAQDWGTTTVYPQ